MKYLLDTDTLIDFLQDRSTTRRQLNALIERGATVAVCAVGLAELFSGLHENKRATWQDWLFALPYWDISPQAAMQAGIYRKTASDKGRTLPVSDCLVAAVAREHNATVLTSNSKDYPMDDVQILSLRETAA